MKTEDIPDRQPALWIPERDLGTLAILGKTGEECGELGAKLCRAVIQGVAGVDPETAEPNIAAIQDEVADLEAMFELLKDRLKMDREAMAERTRRKIAFKAPWLAALDAQATVGVTRKQLIDAMDGIRPRMLDVPGSQRKVMGLGMEGIERAADRILALLAKKR